MAPCNSKDKDVLACASQGRPVRTLPDPHIAAHPPARFLGNERGVKTWHGASGANQALAARRNHAIRGGQGGKFSGRNGAAERASHEDISTIFLPASLMPHSHRLPPFSTLLYNCPFPSSSLLRHLVLSPRASCRWEAIPSNSPPPSRPRTPGHLPLVPNHTAHTSASYPA